MTQKAQLPAFKVGGQWWFKRTNLDRLIDSQKTASLAGGPR
jgi:hypothetical protein